MVSRRGDKIMADLKPGKLERAKMTSVASLPTAFQVLGSLRHREPNHNGKARIARPQFWGIFLGFRNNRRSFCQTLQDLLDNELC